jgi:hypothetical protein
MPNHRPGHKCTVVAPSMIPRKPGERIKTDRRDSEKLAILHRSGDLTPVWVPDTTHEALRDLVRARVDASMHLMRTRQQLLAFLLRHGRSYPTGKHWTQRHRSWLAGQTFQEHAHGIVFQDYLETVWTAQQRRDALIERISAMVGSWSLGPRRLAGKGRIFQPSPVARACSRACSTCSRGNMSIKHSPSSRTKASTYTSACKESLSCWATPLITQPPYEWPQRTTFDSSSHRIRLTTSDIWVERLTLGELM